MRNDSKELSIPGVDVRAGDPATDAIDGVVPGVVIEPQSARAVAAALEWASGERLAVVIRGAGTKMLWGRIPERVDAVLSMRRLDRVLSHRHGDLTATVEAGVRLCDLNRLLAAHRQQLPLDPPFADKATVGGLLATNDSGPVRHRFGTPRDLVIGVQIATTDGHVANAGGQVVKNVAGYDLSKLVSGSFGTLAAIVSATFKLLPVPAASSTLVVSAARAEQLAHVVAAIVSSQLEPIALECHMRREGHESRAACLVRFAGPLEAVENQVSDARPRIVAEGGTCDVVTGDSEARLWREHGDGLWQGSGSIVRASWLPADFRQVIETLDATPAAVELVGRVGVGAGLIRLDGDVDRQAAAIAGLRESATFGNVVLVRGPRELKTRVDVWGVLENARLIAAVKRALDVHDTLGARRYP